MPTVSIILDTTLPTGSLAHTLASVEAQEDVTWELLVAGHQLDAEQLARCGNDARVRVLETGGTGAMSLNALLGRAQGEIVACLLAGSVWPSGRLAAYRREVGEATNGVCVIVPSTSNDDTLGHHGHLATICAEEAIVESGLAFRRELLGASGLLNAHLDVGAWWDLTIRLLRTGFPRFVGAGPEEHERELTLDLVASALGDALHVHAHVADLAEELPGVTLRQWQVRQQLYGYLTEGLPVLVDALGHEAVASQLCRLTDRVLTFGSTDDREAMRTLLRAADRAAVRDLPLHHRRLMLLRAMGQSDAVVLACQAGTYPLDAQQLGELIHALRHLGAHEDADRVAHSAPEATLSPLPERLAVRPAMFPAWLTATTADAGAWREAARGYAELGLQRAMAIAEARASGASVPADRALPTAATPATVTAATAMDQLDAHLALSLAHASWPLGPVPLSASESGSHEPAGSAPVAVLEPSGRQLRAGAFGAWLLDLCVQRPTRDDVLAMLTHDGVHTAMPRSEATPLQVVDLAPDDGYRACMLMARPSAAFPITMHLLAQHALQQARLRRALATQASQVHVHTSATDVAASLDANGGRVIIHTPLRAEALPRLEVILAHVSRLHHDVVVLWSGTEVPCIWSSEMVQTCLDVARHAAMHTTALIRCGEAFDELPLDVAPRAHLLISRRHHAHA